MRFRIFFRKTMMTVAALVLCACVSLSQPALSAPQPSKGPWEGKTWYAFGDSITSLGYYIDAVNEDLGTISLKYDHSGFSYPQLAEVYTEMISGASSPDLITLFAGTNDFGHSGSIDEMEKGLRTILEGLFTAYPNVQIIVITPLQRNCDAETRPIETSGLGPNSQGKYLVDYVRAIMRVSESYGVPCLDLYTCGGITMDNARAKTMNGDGLHPSKEYGPVIGHIIAGFIRNYEPFVYGKQTSDAEGINENIEPASGLKLTPQDLTTAFVSRCYRLILNRNPDAGGLRNWSAALMDKTTAAANVIDSFFRSNEYAARNVSDEDSVDILYKAILNRPADKGGRTGWVDALGKGYTLQHIINGFCGSAEFMNLCEEYGIEAGTVDPGPVPTPGKDMKMIKAFVSRCYQIILNREADEGGLNSWAAALADGSAQASQIIDGFVRSAEFTNRNFSSAESVDILYKAMLGREADAAGKAGWVDALGKGYTLQHIINDFCGSVEFTNICSEYGITPGSVAVAGTMVRREAIAPEGEEEAAVAFFSSEFINEEKIRAFVEHCYEAVFGRQGDEEGIANYTKLIMDGEKTPKKVAYEFIFSPEFQNQLPGNEAFIRILYKMYFDRVPGAEEVAGWVAMLEGGTSMEEIVNGFAASVEFKAIVNAMKEYHCNP